MEEIKQIKYINKTPKRQAIINLFIALTILLLVLPLYNTISDVFTRIIISFDWYQPIKDYIVPIQVRMIAVILMPFGLAPSIMGEYLAIGKENPYLIEIAWNCIGLQSSIFFIITVMVEFSGGHYTKGSKLKSVIIGLIGTFFINIFRIIAVILSFYCVGELFASIIHNYASLIVQIAWLFLFWWFSYSFMLEEK